MTDTPERQGHAVLDLPSRRHKGEKIERILELDPASCYDLLEVGTGSGGIAHYFATQARARCNVVSVDVEDTRLVSDGYEFKRVKSTALPFPDDSFDVVLTNHVIEHVGNRTAQEQHLAEIRRVLRPNGIVYLAVPNRWMLVEPHYKLAFLSWLPRKLRTPWLKLWGKGKFYDCEPLQLGELEALAREASFLAANRSTQAFRLTLAIEGVDGYLARLVSLLPDGLIDCLQRVNPTHIYVLRPTTDSPSCGATTWAGGSTVRVVACPACGGRERSAHARGVVDHLDPSGRDSWQVWRCRACESLYPDPRPCDESLAAAYTHYYTHNVDPEDGGQHGLRGRAAAYVNHYLNRRFGGRLTPSMAPGFTAFSLVEPWRLKLDYFGAHLFLAAKGGGRRVLDVGCGNGVFLHRALSLGWQATGLDPDPTAVQAARSQGLDVHLGFVDSKAVPVEPVFDAIVFRHSIEHVINIQANLRSARHRLKPGGMIWLAWPNPTGPGARYFRESWRGLEVPRHLCIPSRAAMTRLLIEAGFERPTPRRRGQHAREIVRESTAIARRYGDPVNQKRASRAGWIRRWADLAATFAAGAGEELVMVAYVPGSNRAAEER